jgi:hypothetical protein
LGLALFTRQFPLPLLLAEVGFRHAGRLPASAAAAATTTTVATTAATVATAAAWTTAAAAAAGLVLGFVDSQRATVELLAVDGLNGARGVRLAHLDEAEAAWATGFTISGERNRFHGAVGCKQLADLVFRGGKRQVAYIYLGHVTLSLLRIGKTK